MAMRVRFILPFVLLLGVVSPRTQEAGAGEYEQRIQWVMGTPLSIQLPRDREDLEELFRACFDEAQDWDDLLSPWKPEAPLSQLSVRAGEWVMVPPELLGYLQRAQEDASRTQGAFDITLSYEGASEIEIDWDGSRARLPVGAHRLDPGGDGKGVALDAVAAHLQHAGVREAFVDFGGSSFLARGAGPSGEGWAVELQGPDGRPRGTLRLVDTALSVSSTVQRERLEDGAIEERFHLVDLQQDKLVERRRSVAVLSASAIEAEVLSTTLAIRGETGLRTSLLEHYSPAALALFEEEAAPIFRGGFEIFFNADPGP